MPAAVPVRQDIGKEFANMRTQTRIAAATTTALAVLVALGAATTPAFSQTELPADVAAKMDQARAAGKKDKPDFPKFEDVSKDYKKVISTADGKSLYTLYTRKKDGQVLAELPGNFEKQKLFVAYNVSGGDPFAGIQLNDQYVYWKRFDKKLALIEPNYAVRTTGDLESKKGLARVFTDRVILDVPIVCMGPGGGPVIDLDALLVGNAGQFFGRRVGKINQNLVTIEKAKAFPSNIELAFTVPASGGRLVTLAYSVSVLPDKTGYTPRVADARIGYFTTTHLDLANPGDDDPYVRYINRWYLEKADPKLKLSPPKEPIVFYLEHTIPVRYRRWVREGILEWNKAYEQVGIINAMEVRQQDARTGAHMDKDPEDVRYNFLLWTNAPLGFAIGPSRVDPRTGQILDADIVMSEGFVRSWARSWHQLVPEVAMEGFGPETLAWLAENPNWDPRVRLAPLAEREQVKARIARAHAHGETLPYGGHPAAMADPLLLGDDPYDGLSGRISQVNGACSYAAARSVDVALFRMNPELFMGEPDDDDDDDDNEPEGDILDGVPDSFIGPLLRDVIMHEVGHTLGLRHNFKASTIYTIQEINTEEWKGPPLAPTTTGPSSTATPRGRTSSRSSPASRKKSFPTLPTRTPGAPTRTAAASTTAPIRWTSPTASSDWPRTCARSCWTVWSRKATAGKRPATATCYCWASTSVRSASRPTSSAVPRSTAIARATRAIAIPSPSSTPRSSAGPSNSSSTTRSMTRPSA
jgi:hypothetical protein